MTQHTNTASGAADRAIEGCPELNMGNYDEVGVERLNDWAIRANDEIDRLHALAAGQATAAPAQPAAQHYGPLRDADAEHRKQLSVYSAPRAQPAAQQGAAYAALPAKYYLVGGVVKTWDEDQMCDFADATHALRASRGQAPAQPEVPPDQMIAECGIKASRMMARDLTRFDAACEVMDYLKKEVRAPYYYLHRMSIVLHGNTEGTEASRAPENSEPTTSPQAAESVPAPVPPPECETEAEKRAFAFGWFKALESERMKAESVQEDAARYRWLAASCRSTSEHWGGRWSIIIDGPAPKSHDSEDDFDAAVDAARKQGEKP